MGKYTFDGITYRGHSGMMAIMRFEELRLRGPKASETIWLGHDKRVSDIYIDNLEAHFYV